MIGHVEVGFPGKGQRVNYLDRQSVHTEATTLIREKAEIKRRIVRNENSCI